VKLFGASGKVRPKFWTPKTLLG